MNIGVMRREVDTLLVVGILAFALYLAGAMAGLRMDMTAINALVGRFLGFSAPAFLAAFAFIVWVSGALAAEAFGLAQTRRGWKGIAAALFYLENAAPFVGLLECFVSIVRALLAYSEAGATAAAQSVLISNIAVALGASAVGCLVALLAHSLKAVIVYRGADR